MAEYNHINYMREVAEKSLDIGHTTDKTHFHRISGLNELEEFLQNISSLETGWHLLVDEDFMGNLNGVDNPMDTQNYMFFLVKCIDANDNDARVEVKRNSLALAKKIIGRMRKHWKTANEGLTDVYGLRNFDTENIFYQTIGPIGVSSYGIETRFSIREKANTLYNMADWDE